MLYTTREVGVVEFVLLGGVRQSEFGKKGDVGDSERADSVPNCTSMNSDFGSIGVIDPCQATLEIVRFGQIRL